MPDSNGLASLPNHPFSQTEIQALDQHPSLRSCQSIFSLREDPDTIVAIALRTSKQTHLLIYNPQEQQWEKSDTFDTPDSITDPSDLDLDTAIDSFGRYYDEMEVSIAADYAIESEDLIELFPSEALSKDQFEAIREHVYILNLSPLARRQSDDRIIIVLIATFDPTDFQGILLGIGYDSTERSWRIIDNLRRPNLDEETTNNFMSSISSWTKSRYEDEEIRPTDHLRDMASSSS